jgi:hypothetical protein
MGMLWRSPTGGTANVARACTNMSTHASQTQAGTHRHVGLAARACTNTSTHASQTQARTQHTPPFWRLPGRLRLLSSASLGGSLFCSWTGEPHHGLGRLFVRKRTRWPHLWARTPWSGNSRLLKPEPTTPQTKHGAPFAFDGAHVVVPQRCVQAGRAAPSASTPFPAPFLHQDVRSDGYSSAGVHGREPRPASLNQRPGPGRGNQHGRRQRRPRTSPRPGVRVHGSTHRPFQPVTASVACAGGVRRPGLLRVTPYAGARTSTRPVYPSLTPAQSLPLTPPSYPPCSLRLHNLQTYRSSGPGRRATFGRSRSVQRTSRPWNTSPSAVCRLGVGGLPLRIVPEVQGSRCGGAKGDPRK